MRLGSRGVGGGGSYGKGRIGGGDSFRAVGYVCVRCELFRESEIICLVISVDECVRIHVGVEKQGARWVILAVGYLRERGECGVWCVLEI